jgi:uncharacterized protein (TIRG00374 family)
MSKRLLKRLLPFVISLILIVILVGYAPWGEVGHALAKLNWQTVVLLVGLSMAYYALKAVRFWYLLVAMGIRKPLGVVALSYISAQPASLLPGGEIFRSHALQRQTGVPVKKSIAQFTMQGILEGAGLATVMLACAIALHALRIPALILSGLVLLSLYALAAGYLVQFFHFLNRVFPFINVSEQSIQHFNARHKDVLNWHWLPFMYGMSLVTELIGTAIAYVSIIGLGGDINVYQAGLMYVIPVVVGFISLLPGGFGLSEQSAIGILLLSNVSTALAVAGTLVMRVTIVGLGVIFGIIALIIGSVRLRKVAIPLPGAETT